jgi:hypothetical protein
MSFYLLVEFFNTYQIRKETIQEKIEEKIMDVNKHLIIVDF